MARRASARRIKKHHSYEVLEAAELLGIHRHTIRRWINSGALPALTEERPHPDPRPGPDRLPERSQARQDATEAGRMLLCEMPPSPAPCLRRGRIHPADGVERQSPGNLSRLYNAHAPAGISRQTGRYHRQSRDQIPGRIATPIRSLNPVPQC